MNRKNYHTKRQNGYLSKQQARIEAWRIAERDTWVQFMADTIMITLNKPEVMGKDVIGQKRILEIFKGWHDTQAEYVDALSDGPEADYYQEKLDERLRQILDKDVFQDFAERYEWIKRPEYESKRS